MANKGENQNPNRTQIFFASYGMANSSVHPAIHYSFPTRTSCLRNGHFGPHTAGFRTPCIPRSLAYSVQAFTSDISWRPDASTTNSMIDWVFTTDRARRTNRRMVIFYLGKSGFPQITHFSGPLRLDAVSPHLGLAESLGHLPELRSRSGCPRHPHN